MTRRRRLRLSHSHLCPSRRRKTDNNHKRSDSNAFHRRPIGESPSSSRRRATAVVPSKSRCAQPLATTSRLRPALHTSATLSHANSHRSISPPTAAARLAVAKVTLPVTV
ncbi:ethylene induced calmodulin binding protein [Striga asiatica]|uniref:Ethylene induced calmodulin binding protein n=1 Tax=Striga asiatica TaxID=4170 RepID=A0A5A7RFC1_STRAF|nr:ethylene induced calmodulin binding protein [Striga asiatica]